MQNDAHVTLRFPAAVGALSLLLLTASPGAAASPAFSPGYKGFHSVLGYGTGQTVNAVDLANNLATGAVPETFTNQADLYNKVITKQPTGDLSGYYKDSSFAEVTGTTTTLGDARIVRDDRFQVPHIYGATRSGAMYAAGYATAQDRLFLMDALRRTAEGSTTELLGESAVGDDSTTLGQFDLSPEELTAEVMSLPQTEGAAGARALADLQQYVAGINAYIQAALANPTLLPAEYAGLGTTPRAWTVADSAAEAYLLIAMFTVFGDGEHLQADVLAKLQKKLGAKTGQAVYDDLRHLDDPSAPVTADRPFPSDRPGAGPSSAVPLDPGSLKPRNAEVSSTPGTPSVPLPVAASWATTLSRGGGLALEHHASNALLLAGKNSKSGHPLAAMGPQVGYYSPEILV
ncbi:MAG: Penicillin amidase, partial [Frankiales bacterium]|nr:Penicillin amidase [Frankiales bacterium]